MQYTTCTPVISYYSIRLEGVDKSSPIDVILDNVIDTYKKTTTDSTGTRYEYTHFTTRITCTYL